LPSSAKWTWSTVRPGESICHGTRPPIVAFAASEETSVGFRVAGGAGAGGSASCWSSSVARIAAASAAWVNDA
jgi:hypothetical protein